MRIKDFLNEFEADRAALPGMSCSSDRGGMAPAMSGARLQS